MGTRHLICVVRNGEYRVAQYGQWDGYPSGQGAGVVEFLRLCNLDRFKQQVDKVRALTREEVHARWEAAGANGQKYVGMDVSNRFKRDNPQLSRDMGSDILSYVYSAETPEVSLAVDFAADSLFCEYGYVVNLDNDTLEVYRGFNKAPVPTGERFADLPFPSDRNQAYFQIRHWKTYAINSLTPLTMTELAASEREDDDGSADVEAEAP